MSASTASAASGASAPSFVAGSARVITSEPDAARRGRITRAGRTRRCPRPARIAAWLTNIGAPVIPPDPPTTITPAIHLCAVGGRGGRSRPTSSAS